MKFNNFNIFSLFKTFSGGYYGVFSVIISLIGDFLALIMFPNYSMLQYNISYLANGPGGIIFNISNIVSGLLAIPFNIYLGNLIKEKITNLYIRKGIEITPLIACLSLSLIGIFPAYEYNPIMLFIHGIFALIFFISVIIVFILYGYLFLKSQKFYKIQGYWNFFIATTILIYFPLGWSILEWIVMFGIMISVLLLSIFILYKGY